ncbi:MULTISPECIES: LysR family transcriptional regulator [unclassified Paraburkholderia]|uniref:LysR family transcriptional regulator n=1 Tax=unclassified Paraburkholderia TaxID=2615204 RepID=UPI00197DE6D0|nr:MULTISPECIES: LysR family transcriptional regulator [unclassified Paraburkholderia]MBN3856948.1 LysR family transcriptional regulator [Paraburkholderia sp. Ac-20340]
MDLVQSMRVFIRVVDAGNFTAAANTLNTTTAYTSRAVSELEAHLQTRLFNRTTRKITLTEAGERFLARSRHILDDLEQAESEARNATVVPSGRLRIHSMSGFGTRYVVPLISRYMEQQPLVEVDLTLHQRMPDLLEESLDVSIVLAQSLKESNYISRSLGSFYSVMCASPGYLARHGAPQSLADLDQHACLKLVMPSGESESWVFENDAGQATFSPQKLPFAVNLPEALAEALACGMGVGVLPASTFVREFMAGRLARVLPEYRLDVRNIYAIYPSRKYLDAKVRTWIEFAGEHLPPLLASDNAVIA